MQITDYLLAGIERWKDSQKLNEGSTQRLLGTCYMAGYTAECILKYIIIKKCKLKSYDEVNKMVAQTTPDEKESFSKGIGVSWLGKLIYSENDLKNEKGFLRALTTHNIRLLINSAVHFNALDSTIRSMISKSAADCYKWDAEWRYGKPYLVKNGFITEKEEITVEKASDFISQVEWLVNEIKRCSGNIEIDISA